MSNPLDANVSDVSFSQFMTPPEEDSRRPLMQSVPDIGDTTVTISPRDARAQLFMNRLLSERSGGPLLLTAAPRPRIASMNNHIRDPRPQRTIDPSTMWDNECRFHRTVAAIEATGGDVMEFYQKVIDGEPWDDTIAESWNPLYKLSDAKPNPSPPEGYSVVSSTGSAVNNARKQRDRSPADINTPKKLKSVAKDGTLSSSDDSDSNRDDDYIPPESAASRKANKRQVQDGRRKQQTHREKKRQKNPQVETSRDDSSSRVTVRGPRK